MHKKKLSKKNGFTLIELLVVIAIIGILAQIVLTSFASSKKKAINSNIQSALAQLAVQAADLDTLMEGAEGAGADNESCLQIFANEKMRTLINFALNQAARPGIFTYCSKASNDFNFTFLAPSYGDSSIYYCVDETTAVKEVSLADVDAIINAYTCNSHVASIPEAVPDEPAPEETPVLSMSVEFNHQYSNIVVTFNQGVYNYEYNDSSTSVAPRIIDSRGNDMASWISGQPLNGGSTYYYSIGSDYFSTYENPCFIGDPDQSYDPEVGERYGPYQAVFDNVYGVDIDTRISSISATINFHCEEAIQ